MKKRTILHMGIDDDLKKSLAKIAAKLNRSLSNLVETVLMDYIKTKKD